MRLNKLGFLSLLALLGFLGLTTGSIGFFSGVAATGITLALRMLAPGLE